MLEFIQSTPWILAAAIFLARIGDVSLGTVRTILVFRGRALIAAAIGFVEVLIWIAAVAQVINDLSAWYLMVAYAAGFATGNMVGVWLEAKLAIGLELVRAVSEDPGVRLTAKLRDKNYSAIRLEGVSDAGKPVEIVFIVERRRKVGQLLRDIEASDPSAFCTVSDVKSHATLALASLEARGSGARFRRWKKK